MAEAMSMRQVKFREFVLPLPTSANRLFVQAGKYRVKTMAYREWRAAAQSALMAQERDKEPVGTKDVRAWVSITARPDLKYDLDNILKATLDALQDARVLDDDRYVDHICVCKGHAAPEGCLHVVVGGIQPGTSRKLG